MAKKRKHRRVNLGLNRDEHLDFLEAHLRKADEFVERATREVKRGACITALYNYGHAKHEAGQVRAHSDSVDVGARFRHEQMDLGRSIHDLERQMFRECIAAGKGT